jgi:hypothetical protein
MAFVPAQTEGSGMPRPSPTLSRYLLATSAPPRHRQLGGAKVRRYRLARVQATGRPSSPERFAHLRRTYD